MALGAANHYFHYILTWHTSKWSQTEGHCLNSFLWSCTLTRQRHVTIPTRRQALYKNSCRQQDRKTAKTTRARLRQTGQTTKPHRSVCYLPCSNTFEYQIKSVPGHVVQEKLVEECTAVEWEGKHIIGSQWECNPRGLEPDGGPDSSIDTTCIHARMHAHTGDSARSAICPVIKSAVIHSLLWKDRQQTDMWNQTPLVYTGNVPSFPLSYWKLILCPPVSPLLFLLPSPTCRGVILNHILRSVGSLVISAHSVL